MSTYVILANYTEAGCEEDQRDRQGNRAMEG